MKFDGDNISNKFFVLYLTPEKDKRIVTSKYFLRARKVSTPLVLRDGA
jgi:hypothetical protein